MTSPAGGASAGSNGDAGGDAQQGEAQTSGPDVGALADQLGQMSQGQEEMRQFLMSQPWAAQQADEGAEAEPDTGFDFSGLDDMGYDQQAAQQFAGAVEAHVQKQVEAAKREWQQEHHALSERMTERERMEQMRDLVGEFPDMANPDVAKQVVQQAHTLAEANGHSDLGAEPWFWRLTYAAQQAFAAAQDEGSDDSDAAHLEGGAGAASAGGQRGDDIAQMLDAAAQGGRSVLPFP